MFSIIFVFYLVTSNLSLAASDTSQKAINYLKSQSASAWQIMALVAAGEEEITGNALKANPGSQAINYAAPIMALSALGEDPRKYPSSDFVAALKGFFDGTQIGDSGTMNDDIFGLLALVASGEPASDTVIVSTKTYIQANQNTDGGWGFATGGASDTNNTAAAIMALIAAGEPSSDASIQKALTYLSHAQNSDGGFPYDPVSPYGTDSDASSTAWVISALYAAGMSPASWSKGENTPLSSLESFQAQDGYFQYQPGSGEDAFSPITTSYALVALEGKHYPIAVFQGNTAPEPEVSFRIEGSNDTVCVGTVHAQTALDVVKNAADQCGYSYTIEELSFGPYVSQINQDEAQGTAGWLYRVNWQSPTVGAADYVVSPADEVLWNFGDFDWQPLQLTTDSVAVNSGDTITATVEYYDGSTWLPVSDAIITTASGLTWETDTAGKAHISISDGIYKLYAQMSGFIRSNRQVVTVGDVSNQSVSVKANVVSSSSGSGNGDQGQVDGAADTISFTVTPNELDFGTIQKGQSVSQAVTISNTGSNNITIEAVVSGDSLFTNNLTLDSEPWQLFSTAIAEQEATEINATLRVPQQFNKSGNQEGVIIFWATP